MSSKGSRFEREVCRQLSLWWTRGASDNVFYRTPTSGGRATSRARKSLPSVNQCGDLCASDPVGYPLLQVVACELKRGYNKEGSLADAFDRKRKGPSLYEKWMHQALRSATDAKAPYWLLIVRRDNMDALVIMPERLSLELDWGNTAPSTWLCGKTAHAPCHFIVCRLDYFLGNVDPKSFGRMAPKKLSEKE